MATLDTAIAGLCRAIDEGDDSVLPILADALEDAGRGDEAMGLRRVIVRGNKPLPLAEYDCTRVAWFTSDYVAESVHPAWISRKELDRLRGGRKEPSCRHYGTRDAAFLALAAALVKE